MSIFMLLAFSQSCSAQSPYSQSSMLYFYFAGEKQRASFVENRNMLRDYRRVIDTDGIFGTKKKKSSQKPTCKHDVELCKKTNDVNSLPVVTT